MTKLVLVVIGKKLTDTLESITHIGSLYTLNDDNKNF